MTLIDARQKASALGFGTRRRLLPFPDGNFIDEFDKKTLLWSFGGSTAAIGRPTIVCIHQVTMQTIEVQETPIQTTIIIDNIDTPC